MQRFLNLCPLAPLTLLVSAVGWDSVIVIVYAISIAIAASAAAAIAIAIVPLCEADLSSYYSATPTLTLFLRNGTEENKEFLYDHGVAESTIIWNLRQIVVFVCCTDCLL